MHRDDLDSKPTRNPAKTVIPAGGLDGKVVVLVDDGLATGATMVAALTAVRRHRPRRLVCAVPVASGEALRMVEALSDETVCLSVPALFQAVGQFYDAFAPVDDAVALHVARAHDARRELAGLRREQLVGLCVDELVPESLRYGHAGNRERFHANPSARAMGHGRDLWARRGDGTIFPVEIGLTPLKGASTGLVLASVIDISARQQAESLIDASREHIEKLNNAGAGNVEHIRAIVAMLEKSRTQIEAAAT
mgnify:CR=1 FL=1